MAMTDIGRLKELEAKATPAPWDVVVPEDDLIHIVHFDGDAGENGELAISSTDVAFASDTINDEANARLIAELRNAAPHLLSEIETLRAENERLAEALRSSIAIADVAADEWDKAPSGMRAGKLLIALSGHLKGYRPDIDEIHSAIAAYDQGKVTI